MHLQVTKLSQILMKSQMWQILGIQAILSRLIPIFSADAGLFYMHYSSLASLIIVDGCNLGSSDFLADVVAVAV